MNLFYWNSLIYFLIETIFADLFSIIKIISKYLFVFGGEDQRKLVEFLKIGHFKIYLNMIIKNINFSQKTIPISSSVLKSFFLFFLEEKKKKGIFFARKKKKISSQPDLKIFFLKLNKIFSTRYESNRTNFSNIFFLKIFFGKKKIFHIKNFSNFLHLSSGKKTSKIIKFPKKYFEKQIICQKKNEKKKTISSMSYEFIFKKNGLKLKKFFLLKKKNFVIRRISSYLKFSNISLKKTIFKKLTHFFNIRISLKKVSFNKFFFFPNMFSCVFCVGYYYIFNFNKRFFLNKFQSILKKKSFIGSKIVLRKNWTFIYVSGVKYLKLGLIGKGGNGKVYKIIDIRKKVFALKKTRIKNFTVENLHGCINEISILKTLNDQPRIINIKNVDIMLHEGLIYIVLEYGVCDLEHLIKKMNKKIFSLLLIKFFWKQILEAVNTIHEGRVVHGDIKPSNFLLVKNSLKIIDFGIAKQIQKDTSNITRNIQIGTLNYMSPEAIMDIPSIKQNKKKFKLSRTSDVWSLGCILFQMIYKKPPFYHLTIFKKIQAIVNNSFHILFLPTNIKFVVDVMKGCLERNPDSRPLISELLDHPFLTSGNILKINKKTIK